MTEEKWRSRRTKDNSMNSNQSEEHFNESGRIMGVGKGAEGCAHPGISQI